MYGFASSRNLAKANACLVSLANHLANQTEEGSMLLPASIEFETLVWLCLVAAAARTTCADQLSPEWLAGESPSLPPD